MRLMVLACAALCLGGCGYVGDPLPPALNIPVAVADLRAVQVGDKILVDYTAPELTTEDVGLTGISSVDVKIGDDSISVIPPKPGEPGHAEFPASNWTGKQVAVRVVLSGPKGQRSQESNAVTLNVGPALAIPANVKAESHPDGVRVSWTNTDARVTKYKIIREPEAQAEVQAQEYIDRTVELGKLYEYRVIAATDSAESLSSQTVKVSPQDTFPPAAPQNLTAVSGVSSIELAWDRNSEPDLKSYSLYRDDALVAQDLQAPTYSDRQLISGQRYRYAVTAVDRLGNESAKSSTVEATAP